MLVADRLDGAPLSADHGAPWRLVAPAHYAYKSTKHLCRIELHRGGAPRDSQTDLSARVLLALVRPHPRGRVAFEERHQWLPARVVLPVYRALIPVTVRLGRRRA